jgi:integrase
LRLIAFVFGIQERFSGSRIFPNDFIATSPFRPSPLTGVRYQPLPDEVLDCCLNGELYLNGTPSQAKHFVTTLRHMFLWVLDQPDKLVRVDPTQGVTFKRSKNDKKGGFPVWFDAEITKYEERWPRGTRERVLFDIYQFTGLRRGDAAVVGKQHVRDGVISLYTEKTGTLVTIPILPELQETLDAGPLGDLAWFAKLNGAPMTKESVGNFFADACKAAGIVGKSGHGVRKAAATEAADNEATHVQLNSIFGWKGDQMASLYTESADRKRLAAGAIAKLSRTKKGTSKPPPDVEVGVLRQKDK